MNGNWNAWPTILLCEEFWFDPRHLNLCCGDTYSLVMNYRSWTQRLESQPKSVINSWRMAPRCDVWTFCWWARNPFIAFHAGISFNCVHKEDEQRLIQNLVWRCVLMEVNRQSSVADDESTIEANLHFTGVGASDLRATRISHHQFGTRPPPSFSSHWHPTFYDGHSPLHCIGLYFFFSPKISNGLTDIVALLRNGLSRNLLY